MDDKYLKYNALELAQDDEFILWARGKSLKLSREWESWLAQHPEKQEVVEEARLIARSLIIREAPVAQERIERVWRKIDTASEETPASAIIVPRPRAYRWLAYAAAAVLAALVAFFFLRPGDAVTIQTSYGQIAGHVLPDGSKVQLNAGTTIRYRKDEWQDSRLVSLEGEAFFEVEKGKPFIVKTPKGEVKVLGTSFNIKTFEGRFDVKCYTGRVQVSADGNQETLTAGQEAEWAGSGWQRATFETLNGPDWQKGSFEYHSAPLREVFADMERQFDIKIEAPDSILSRTYTGAYERNALDSALYRVCWPMNLKARREGDEVAIRPAGIPGE